MTITLTFSNDLNVSLQENTGDIVYYKSNSSGLIYQLGECTSITSSTIDVTVDAVTPRPVAGDFIFFAKSPISNTSGLVGYYAEVDIEITSTDKKELFAVSSEIFISS